MKTDLNRCPFCSLAQRFLEGLRGQIARDCTIKQRRQWVSECNDCCLELCGGVILRLHWASMGYNAVGAEGTGMIFAREQDQGNFGSEKWKRSHSNLSMECIVEHC